MASWEDSPAPPGRDAVYRAIAPGRVNLIGEHTDYTGGFVLPMAIPFQTEARIRPAVDGQFTFASDQVPTILAFAPEHRRSTIGEWSDYAVGVLHELQALGMQFAPFHLNLNGNVPLGAGLSSSASVEVATAAALLLYAQKTLSIPEIAKVCQRAENDFVGSPCGIMDQFVITAAEPGHALLIDTRALTWEQLPMNTGELADCAVVVINSMVRHTVTAGSDYAQRRSELESGQTILRTRCGIQDLRDATLEQLAAYSHEMSPEAFRRCRHVISENGRVCAAASAMRSGDARLLGELMVGSHTSQRDDFECSTPEIDFLVETALQSETCYGARLTGGGFGGCTVNLVRADQAGKFASAVRTRYLQVYEVEAETYICTAAAGAVANTPSIISGSR